MKTPSCDSSILPQKYLAFTDNYPNTQGFAHIIYIYIYVVRAELEILYNFCYLQLLLYIEEKQMYTINIENQFS